MAAETNTDICDININTLQQKLAEANVMIHFDDALVPKEEQIDTIAEVEGHF